jgi:hypothetical protein
MDSAQERTSKILRDDGFGSGGRAAAKLNSRQA